MDVINTIYVYCTYCVINLANLTGLSYYEINFFLFCIGYPLLLIGSIVLLILQKFRLKKYRYAKKTNELLNIIH
jgi:hypothetical protein